MLQSDLSPKCISHQLKVVGVSVLHHNAPPTFNFVNRLKESVKSHVESQHQLKYLHCHYNKRTTLAFTGLQQLLVSFWAFGPAQGGGAEISVLPTIL